MSKSTKNILAAALLSKANGKSVALSISPSTVFSSALSPAHKAAATKRRNAAEAVAVAEAARLAYLAMSPGKKSAETKRRSAATAATQPRTVATPTHALSPAHKAAATKRRNAAEAAELLAMQAVAPTPVTVASPVPVVEKLTPAMLDNLIALIPALRAAGLLG